MTRLTIAFLIAFTLSLTACALQTSGPNRRTSLHYGMTDTEVRAAWGRPWHAAHYRAGGTLYETYSYRVVTKLMTMLGPPATYVDWYTVDFVDGRVVGGSW